MILYDDKLKIIHMTGKHMSLPNNHARFAALNAAFVQVVTPDYPKLFISTKL